MTLIHLCLSIYLSCNLLAFNRMILLFVTRKDVVRKDIFYVLRKIIFMISLLEKLLIFNIIGTDIIIDRNFHISSKEQKKLIFVNCNVLFSIFSFAW